MRDRRNKVGDLELTGYKTTIWAVTPFAYTHLFWDEAISEKYLY